jgi:PKD repeat protein
MKPVNTFSRNLIFLIFFAIVFIFTLAAGKQNFFDDKKLQSKLTFTPPEIRTCATMDVHEQLLQTDPDYGRNQTELENFIREYAGNPEIQTREVVQVPVVFHIVYKLPEENISDAQVLSQLQVLNDDFRKLNADTTMIPPPYKPLASDIEIEFCMAQRDPDGNLTNGITRTQTVVPVFTIDDNVKSNTTGGKDAWDRDKYLNIWICDLGPVLLGYAQFPGGPAATDGVVCHYKYTGTTGTSTPPYHKGRTATHEVGHWFNLRHIWGDETCGNDLVDDTPTQESDNGGCPVYPHRPNSCSHPNPHGDMYMNYMDYVRDSCMQMFSEGQSLRMRAVIDGSRLSLKTSDGCIPPVPQVPVANFDVNKDTVITGSGVNYVDLTSGMPESWNWSFPGGDPASSNIQNPQNILYTSTGSYSATLSVSNTLGNDLITKNNIVTVINAHSGNNTAAGNNLYYFANSTIYANAPSQPEFHWSDTSGSTNLILNSIPDLLSNTGGVDDGYFTLNLNTILPGKVFKLFGMEYSGNLYIATNGIIAFNATGLDDSRGYNPDAIPSTVEPNAALYPFWVDLDFDDPGYLQNRLSYKTNGDTLIITYDKAAIWGARLLESDYVSFQAKMVFQDAGVSSNSFFVYNYDESKCGASFMDLYRNNTIQGLSGSGQVIGAEDASGTQAVSYRFVSSGGQERVKGPMFMSSVSVAFGSDENALPVELVSFTSAINKRDVILSWITSMELNNSGFDIERKVPDSQWLKIGNVEGNGTVNEPKEYIFTDKNLKSGKYEYRLKQIDYNGNYEYYNLNPEVVIGLPQNYELSQNYPNPFNPLTKINFALPIDGNVSLRIYDITGREIKTLLNEFTDAGYHSIEFNAGDLSSGIYFYTMRTENHYLTKKMILLR